jgi:hypothetical protein
MAIQTMVARNVMRGPTIAPCSLTTFVPQMIQEKNHSTSDSETPCWVHHQLVLFDPPCHKVIHDNYNTFFSNPSNNNKT